MKNRQIIDEEKAYCDIKTNGLETIKPNVTSRGCERLVKALSRNYPDLANRDADIEWLCLCAQTNNFTKPLAIKKAEKLIAIAQSKLVIGDTAFANECKQKALSYIEMCRATIKKKRRIRIGASIACAAFAVLAAIGVWY